MEPAGTGRQRWTLGVPVAGLPGGRGRSVDLPLPGPVPSRLFPARPAPPYLLCLAPLAWAAGLHAATRSSMARASQPATACCRRSSLPCGLLLAAVIQDLMISAVREDR